MPAPGHIHLIYTCTYSVVHVIIKKYSQVQIVVKLKEFHIEVHLLG